MNKHTDGTMGNKRNVKFCRTRGQSLVEILVALGIGVILVGGVTALISVNLRSSAEAKMSQSAASLAPEMADGVRAIAGSNWGNFYGLAKGASNKYHIASSTLAIVPGTEQVTVGGYRFTRYFYIENVKRTRCGIGSTTDMAITADCASNFPIGEGSVAEDPLTQKIFVVVEWTGGRSIQQTQYISRTRNAAIKQTDWSGGGGDDSVLMTPNNRYSSESGLVVTDPGVLSVALSGGSTSTTGNMDAGAANHWAWNDIIGWIDFGYAPGNVGVNDVKLFGYASSSVGLIAFDCETSPTPNCAIPWGVANTNGTLNGWAWNDAIGWISFDSVTAGSPVSYGVTIDPGTRELNGWAWNDAIGWISFNCANQGTCGTVNYKVKTGWTATPITGSLVSPIFDLGGRVALNAVAWNGAANGGAVRFQIAASNVPNPASWSYKGPDGTAVSMYTATAGASTQVSPRDLSDIRYVRYKVFIDSNAGRTASPSVDDIIINYSL